MSAHIRDDDLHGYADGELPADARIEVDRHLAACTGCRRELDAFAQVRTELRAMPTSIEPPRDLLPEILQRMSESLDPFPKILQRAPTASRAAGEAPRPLALVVGDRSTEASPAIAATRSNAAAASESHAAASDAPHAATASGTHAAASDAPHAAVSEAPHAAASDAPHLAAASGSCSVGAIVPRRPAEGSKRMLRPILALAAALVLFFAGWSLFFSLRDRRPPRPLSQECVEAAYAIELRDLVHAINERRSSLRPETWDTINANLRIIDQAIANSRAALDEDPASQDVAEILSFAYEMKLELLRHAEQMND